MALKEVASAQVDLSAPAKVQQPSFHPSLGLPEDRLVYRVCPLWRDRQNFNEDQGRENQPRQDFHVQIPPAAVPLVFAHRQWLAGLLMGDFIAAASSDACSSTSPFNVTDCAVLELGCGTGIPGMVAASVRGGANNVLVTDFDSPPLIQTLRKNVTANFSASDLKLKIRATGFTWGTNTEDLEDLLEGWGRERKRLSGSAKSVPKTFDRILMADCLWDSLSHSDLLKSLCLLLSKPGLKSLASSSLSSLSSASVTSQQHPPTILVISGLHTNRSPLLSFIRKAHRLGLELCDVDADASLNLPRLPPDAFVDELPRRSKEDPLYNAREFIYELELSSPPPSSSRSQGREQEGEGAIIDSGYEPRLTGRRRPFVFDDEVSYQSLKTRGAGGEEGQGGEGQEGEDVRKRNRWITVWGLRWRENVET